MAATEYAFTDLVDLDIILDMMNGFHRITGFPPSITDTRGKLLLTVGFKTICRDFHRRHPETRKKCHDSDTWLAGRLSEHNGYACYECLNGLTDVALPIVIDGQHLANLFIGQFFMDKPPDQAFFRRQAQAYGFDVEAYMQALDQVPVFSPKEVEEAATFLASLAQLIGEMGLGQKRLADLNAGLEDTIRERTAQLQSESEVRKRALAEFEAIFNNSSVAIVHLKGPALIHNVNKQFETIFGYSRSEVLGVSLRLLDASRNEYNEHKSRHYPALEKGDAIHDECQFMTKDGRLIWCSYHGSAINPPNLEDGIILILNDISERKELEALKEDVDRIMHHDLKAPLNGIVGLAQYLLMDNDMKADQQDALRDILASGLRMSNQINRSLEIYKIESGTFDFAPSQTDMAAVTRTVLRDLAQDARLKLLDINITVRGLSPDAGGPVPALADELLSSTMLSNLITNSVEAAPPNTAVTITLDEDDTHVSIAIHNEGAVPKDIHNRFFDKYVTSRKTRGTGLGTYTARLMAEAQHGTIDMETGEETGTTVTIRLPRADPG